MLICNNTVYVYLFVVSTLSKYGRKMTLQSEFCSCLFNVFIVQFDAFHVHKEQYMIVEGAEDWLYWNASIMLL